MRLGWGIGPIWSRISFWRFWSSWLRLVGGGVREENWLVVFGVEELGVGGGEGEGWRQARRGRQVQVEM